MTEQHVVMLRSIITQYWGTRAESVLPDYTHGHLAPLWPELVWAALNRHGLYPTQPVPPTLGDLLGHCRAICDEQQRILASAPGQATQQETLATPRIHLSCRLTPTFTGPLCRVFPKGRGMTPDPALVTCQACRRKYGRLPADRQQQILLPVPQEKPACQQ